MAQPGFVPPKIKTEIEAESEKGGKSGRNVILHDHGLVFSVTEVRGDLRCSMQALHPGITLEVRRLVAKRLIERVRDGRGGNMWALGGVKREQDDEEGEKGEKRGEGGEDVGEFGVEVKDEHDLE